MILFFTQTSFYSHCFFLISPNTTFWKRSILLTTSSHLKSCEFYNTPWIPGFTSCPTVSLATSVTPSLTLALPDILKIVLNADSLPSSFHASCCLENSTIFRTAGYELSENTKLSSFGIDFQIQIPNCLLDISMKYTTSTCKLYSPTCSTPGFPILINYNSKLLVSTSRFNSHGHLRIFTSYSSANSISSQVHYHSFSLVWLFTTFSQSQPNSVVKRTGPELTIDVTPRSSTY